MLGRFRFLVRLRFSVNQLNTTPVAETVAVVINCLTSFNLQLACCMFYGSNIVVVTCNSPLKQCVITAPVAGAAGVAVAVFNRSCPLIIHL